MFASSLVNGFDLLFVIIFLASFFARVYGTAFHNMNAMGFGADLLALGGFLVFFVTDPSGAVLIFPRLVFMTLANNLMILSIRSMLAEFFCKLSLEVLADTSPYVRRHHLLPRLPLCAVHTRRGPVQAQRDHLVAARDLLWSRRDWFPHVV